MQKTQATIEALSKVKDSLIDVQETIVKEMYSSSLDDAESLAYQYNTIEKLYRAINRKIAKL